jgi:hypothetical protein
LVRRNGREKVLVLCRVRPGASALKKGEQRLPPPRADKRKAMMDHRLTTAMLVASSMYHFIAAISRLSTKSLPPLSHKISE